MPDASDLILAERSGLPDEIAYLRAAHPVAARRDHPNFGQLSAFWLQVHDGLRAETGQLHTLMRALQAGQVEPARFPQAFAPRFNHFLQHLHTHHTIEDSAYFPKFRALDARMVRGFDLLERDHHGIEAALQGSVDSARALLPALASPDAEGLRRAADAHAGDLDRLQRLLTRHLADEEDLVIPALLEHGERAVA